MLDKSVTVLVLDDEVEDLELMQKSLSIQGFRVITAMTSQEAIRLATQYPIGLLVTDVSIPGSQNGCDVASKLLTDNPALKVLFVSGYVGAEVCKFHGVSVSDLHFLRKPFSVAQFIRQVKSVLESPEQISVRSSFGQAGL